MGHAGRPLRELGEALRSEQDERLLRVDLAPGREQLLRAVAHRPRRRTVPAIAAAIAIAAGVLLFFVLRPRPLSFAVGDAQPGRVEAWIAAGEAALPLRFSDGTVLSLDPGARARVASIDDRGARLVLEQGSLSASVVHRDATRWNVDVGPFEVRVTGTRFDVGWRPEGEVFRLALQEGSVVVTGPMLGEGRAVTAGQTLEIHCRERRLSQTTADAPAARGSAAAAPAGDSSDVKDPAPPAVPRADAPPGGRASTAQPAATTPAAPGASIGASAPPGSSASAAASAPSAAPDGSPPRPTFRELAAAGKYDEAVRAAEAEGFAAVCERASAADLMMLADAARFSGHGARAGEALTILRRRFPGDPRAATAAFLLGRTAFEHGGGCAEATRWFSVYLAEQPGGSLAGEAAGRLMECRERSGDRAGAREAARRYLDAYPSGPRAEAAKRILAEADHDGAASGPKPQAPVGP
ncbi:MAG: FecR family protein [Minicystis sp.]